MGWVEAAAGWAESAVGWVEFAEPIPNFRGQPRQSREDGQAGKMGRCGIIVRKQNHRNGNKTIEKH